jgi:hypothetical protein
MTDGWTKGPWRVEGPDEFGDFNVMHGGDSLAVAAVVSNLRPPKEVAANARLIVAAPELHDACVKIFAVLGSWEHRSPNPAAREAIAAVRAALSRAGGGDGGERRPPRCRFRLIDEEKPYPKSSCEACGRSVLTGLGKACAEIAKPPEPPSEK